MEPGALGLQQYPDANNEFLSGKYAMVMMGTWYMQYATQAGMPPAIAAAGVANPKPFTMVAIPFPNVAGRRQPGHHVRRRGLRSRGEQQVQPSRRPRRRSRPG